MTRDELERILDEAQSALDIGDVPILRAALDRFDEGVRVGELTDDPIVARSWVLRLAAHRAEGQPETVLASGSRLARQARRNGWNDALCRVLCTMGRSALDLSDYGRARLWFEEATSAAEALDDHSLRALAILGLATIWEIQGEATQFLREAERALPHAEQGEDLIIRADVLSTLGRARLRLGEPDGESMLTRAEALLEEARAHVSLLKNLLDHLVLPMSQGDLDTAEALLMRAEALAELVHDRQTQGRVALDRGELLRLRGNPDAALAKYGEALELLPEGHPVARVALLNLALTEITHGHLEDARARVPELLEATRGHALFQGLAHLMALAVGPTSKRISEDELWLAHGTPARLPLRNVGGDPDIDALAHIAARRMVERADPVQAGRAALVHGIASSPDAFIVRAVRRSRGAIPVGPFLAIQRIGAGGMGEVWLGRHVDTDIPAAIKVVNPERSKSEAAFASFENELRAIATLDHPNIVRLLDHGRAGRAASWMTSGRVDATSPYLALEFVRGGPISRWMGKMSWPQIRRVLTDLLQALAHAHARRVLHLDLKPDNVLLNEPGRPEAGVRLTDFGLALLRDQSRDAVAGTIHFMAPEQFVGKDLGTHSDLYALGCMAWGMMTDRAPFEADSHLEMQSLHAVADLPAFEPKMTVPSGILPWLQKLLRKNPRDRFTRASDALAALDRLDPTPLPAADTKGSTALVVAEAGLSLARERQPALVGHQEVRDTLWRALLDCRRRGRPKAVELHGPLGSGRTALASWLGTRAHEEGIAEVVWHDPEQGLASLFDGPPAVSPGSLALRLLRTLDAQRNGRVAVVVAHAADPVLPEVLDILLREADGPLFFVVRTPPGQLKRNRQIQRISLRPLPDEQIRALLRSLLPLTPAFEDRMVRWSEGNAGLALAQVRQLAASGDLRPTRNGWESPHIRKLGVPRAVAQALKSTLAEIGDTPERWEALQIAAALGTHVDAPLWGELATARDDVAQALVDALVLARDGEDYRWRQPAARHLLTEDRSIRLAHGRVAEHLREHGAPPRLVGRHFVAAHLYADAHRPLLDAVAQALDEGQPHEARALLDEWQRVLDRLAVSERDPRRLAGRRLDGRIQAAGA